MAYGRKIRFVMDEKTPRIVIVTGGGTGIGRAVAARFSAAGDKVLLVGRRAEVLDETAEKLRAEVGDPPRINVAVADLSDPDQVEQLRATVAHRFGRVDVLVNAAGGNAAIDVPAGVPDGAAGAAWRWQKNFELNVLTAVLPIEALKGLFSDHARVLLFSSIAAFRGSGSGSYAGAKAALHPYAIDLAGELGPRGITVNVIAPGYIAGTEFFRGGMTADREQTLISQSLNHRVGTVEDVAETAHWLASPGAGHVTAQIVQVNGGTLPGR
jgi:3-oxoacyl-[acyl-carrier protein] reductase